MGTIDEDTAAEVIPEKDSTVLVYCRSGNRSKTASSALAELGYTNIYEFGGINTWPYETKRKKGVHRPKKPDKKTQRKPTLFSHTNSSRVMTSRSHFFFISLACSLQA